VFGNFEETESGYKQLKAHPLPWLVEILNGSSTPTSSSSAPTEYSKGASRGSWDGGEGVWANFDKRNQIAAE
jgi:ribonucleoside-diphosphate reductase beta chain